MRPRLALITGLSGSGKSTVAKCFEDLGYYCVDNLPLPLLRHFFGDPLAHIEGADRIAVVADVRAPGLAEELPRLIDELDRNVLEPTLLFLEASNEVLVRRFSETRRRHPLAGDRPVIQGIRRERNLLADLRGMADMIFDTSEWSIREIRAHVYREFGQEEGREPGLVVSLVSFGFKHGIPYGTDLLFDVRYLPNPHFVPELRDLTGEDRPVQEYLEGQADFPELLGKLTEFLLYLLPRFQKEHRTYLTVAVGCTGGNHRSVAVCERLARSLGEEGWSVKLVHRDLERG